MGSVLNLDLLSVGVAVAANVIIGYSVYRSNSRSATSILFFIQTIILSLWSLANYISYQSYDPKVALFLVRLVLFLAVPNSICFLILMHTFPSETLRMAKTTLGGLILVTLGTMVLTFTPLVFSGVTVSTNSAPTPIPGPGILAFAIVAILSIPIGFTYLIRNFRRSESSQRSQYQLFITGIVLMFVLIFGLDFVFPSILGNSRFIPLSAVFTFPFVIFTAYAIYRHHLFKVRDILTGVLTFSLSLVTFIEIIFATQLTEFILRISVFILTLIISIQLIRKTFDLEEVNERQEGLIHFIGHEVKGFLTKAQGTFSLLVDGDLGQMPDTMRPFVERALQDTKDGVTSVSDILKASNMKKGTVTFAKESFDLKALVEDSVEKARQTAEGKGLKLSLSVEGDGFQMTGDKGEIGDHVLRNLIDNAVNYTPSGSIEVSLKKAGGKYVFAVKDTGVGITPEDKARLFTEGGHGKESQKVNVHSTGYGLFIAKQVVDAHGGTISASSAGPGTGSTFTCEFPILN